MNNLPKQILNYFATFTETRFNFKRLINYRWTNNELTLDLSLYPDFQRLLLDSIRNGALAEIAIIPGQHILVVKKEELVTTITKIIQDNFSAGLLQKIFDEEINRTVEANQPNDNPGTQNNKSTAWREATRAYNLKLRKELENTLPAIEFRAQQLSQGAI